MDKITSDITFDAIPVLIIHGKEYRGFDRFELETFSRFEAAMKQRELLEFKGVLKDGRTIEFKCGEGWRVTTWVDNYDITPVVYIKIDMTSEAAELCDVVITDPADEGWKYIGTTIDKQALYIKPAPPSGVL